LKKILSFLFAAILLFSLGSTSNAQQESPAIRMAENISVTILGDGRTVNSETNEINLFKERPYCSGFVLKTFGTKQVILTARHCLVILSSEFSIIAKKVHFFDGDIGIVKKMYASPDDDFGILLVESRHKHFVEAKFADVKYISQPLFLFGNANGIPWSYSSAVSMNGNVEIETGDGYLIQLESPSGYNGDSGCAAFDMEGNVVGITVYKTDNAIFIVPSSHITKITNQLKYKKH